MPQARRAALITALSLAVLAGPARAQQPGTLIADLLTDIGQVHQKLTSLAQAIPADKWGWRPGQGVRSVGEVYLHVAADNYLLPGVLGTPAPAATGIRIEDYATVQAFERRAMPRDQALAEMERSFVHLKRALQGASTTGENISVFGQTFTRQGFLILLTTHLHEHLGQLIAYARSVGVAPPWSQGG